MRPEEANYDAIVIGGGPNGLLCAAHLARSGSRVALLERRHETGGGLNTDEYFGFRLNLHAIYHMMADVMPSYRELDLASWGVGHVFPPAGAAFPLAGGECLVVTRDPRETAASIALLSEADASCYHAMWDEFQPMLERYLIPLTYALPDPPIDQMEAMQRDEIGRRLAGISELGFTEILDEYGFTDPRVRMALLAFPAMWGLDLSEPLGYLFPLYLCRMAGSALVKGGSHRLSSALLRVLVSCGGTVVDQAEAARLIIENGAAAGVETADGRVFRAPAVVSTLNPEQTFLGLVGRDRIPAELAERAAAWEWEERTLFGLHLGVRGEVAFRDPRAGEALVTFLGLETEDDLHEHLRRVDAGGAQEAEWIHVTVPSRFDPTQAPPGHHVARIEAVVRYDEPWDTLAAPFGDSCLALLERHADVGEIVLRRDVPPTHIAARLSTMKRGSIKHGAYTPLQMGFFRPNDLCSRVETPVAGLFVAGASVYPGGMILGGPGYLGAQVVGEFLAARETQPPGAPE
ncbi:MAG: NAD(P)/FAD-dependent oxidoreductase [Acidobacteria bacterium]|nr:NAD(P)/FAD-dependent oxidoreductase [Acidobacteriota bacterium]